MEIKIEAVQIAEVFNIKKFRSDYNLIANSGSTSEVFYVIPENNRYLYLFDYGVIVFANYDQKSKKDFINFIKSYATSLVRFKLSEEYLIVTNENLNKIIVENAFVSVPKIDNSLLKIVMLNIGQSVALEHYEILSDTMINSSKEYILQLETNGKLNVSKNNLLKHIGKVLNVKNSIIDNLYILDDPNLVWDNEELNLLNRHLKINFDINSRFKGLDYRLQIVEDNLTIFTNILNVKESNRLEWIIILLILSEIIINLIFH
ncbi:RMD1 family protein [Flavobacterium sufflavum]|uniref:RMD1 family protein n=1 Tax=Flavobacterium sufflavum TaxID=1921138 RepID=A0A437KLM4_9FLAO|nr:RMD1 family protein [Flavobacterium sufflavum]RVT72012.1 RMD1 family protein [Flavobacterium sufflavum]